jgi:hypothetical protein
MTRLVLDASMIQRLQGLAQPLELCDESGRVLAHVLPAYASEDYESVEPEISEEELQRRESSDEPCYTTEEVLAHLRSL